MDRTTLIVLAAAVLAAVQRLLREDVKVFPSLVSPYRGLVVAVIGLIATPSLDAALNGSSVLMALTTGIVAIVPTLANIVASIFASGGSGTLKYGTWVSTCALLLLPGCAGRFEEAKAAGKAFRSSSAAASVDCVAIDDAHIVWDAVAKGAAGLAGAQGIAIIPLDDKTGRIALAAGVVGASTIAVIAGAVAAGEAAKWARYCSGVAQ